MTQLTKRKANGDGLLFPFGRRGLFPSQLFGAGMFDDDFWNRGMSMPPANITETEKEFKLDLSVPGFKKEDFKIDMENGVLSVSSETKEEQRSEEKNYKRQEFSYSSFSRSFQLPDNADEDKISAKYEDGVLQVTIPKKEGPVSQPKKQVKVM